VDARSTDKKGYVMFVVKDLKKIDTIDARFVPWIGLFCTEIKCDVERQWSFTFVNRGSLMVFCPWRIIAKGGIALGTEDDGQKFGLSSPINAAQKAFDLLSQKSVIKVTAFNESGDLNIFFNDNVRLEVFNNSSGYEGWHACVKNESDTTEIVAQGGGEICLLENNEAS
jgi:hypothetical protein